MREDNQRRLRVKVSAIVYSSKRWVPKG